MHGLYKTILYLLTDILCQAYLIRAIVMNFEVL